MLNQKSLRAVDNSKFSSQFVKPLYDSYCFANIPDTIKKLFGIKYQKALPADTLKNKRANKVVFLFIDAFGWEFWKKHHQKFPFLRRFLTKGVVSKLTSQFPSTTVVHETTIHTGLPIGKSGILEWYYYEPLFDTIIIPLLFSYANVKKRDSLMSAGIEPEKLYPNKAIYSDLTKAKIKSYIFRSKDYTPSTFSNILFKKATKVFPYRSLAQGLTEMSETILNTNNPAYYFFYYSTIDTSGHVDGPNSLIHQAEISNLFTALENLFYKQIKNKSNLTILLSADHGTAKVSPKQTFYLNREIKGISKYFRTNRQKQLLVPAGSCRNMFLYTKERTMLKLKELLQQKLYGKAEVYETQELLTKGFFGKQIDKRLIDRIPNLIVLSYNNQAVWWYEKNKFEQKYFGHHGGLTREEMEIPFLSLVI
jgi:predicted AlkP superfamily pyrophosphatase or phosphodiesterase